MEIDKKELDRLVELVQSGVKSITKEGHATVIEFENGDRLPLYGGGAEILDLAPILACSFCGAEQTKERPLLAPPRRDEPLICPQCAIRAVELFAGHGVEIELDLSKLMPGLAEQVLQQSELLDTIDTRMNDEE